MVISSAVSKPSPSLLTQLPSAMTNLSPSGHTRASTWKARGLKSACSVLASLSATCKSIIPVVCLVRFISYRRSCTGPSNRGSSVRTKGSTSKLDTTIPSTTMPESSEPTGVSSIEASVMPQRPAAARLPWRVLAICRVTVSRCWTTRHGSMRLQFRRSPVAWLTACADVTTTGQGRHTRSLESVASDRNEPSVHTHCSTLDAAKKAAVCRGGQATHSDAPKSGL
mmetsp:Transcript_21375/g.46899  ORF Transcript_21375/g.46899 Transcript_21375/m.46899 type:complete len:225 (-) Transcript_21375:2165-2839(-)